MTLETIGSACADPAAAVISRFGVARACEQRAVFDHAASLMVYHWVCADGFKPADVAPVVRATNTTTAQLVDVFGEERWHDIDGALFDATKAVVDWSAARAKAASAALIVSAEALTRLLPGRCCALAYFSNCPDQGIFEMPTCSAI